MCLCMFQLAPVTISTQQHQLCGRCGADKTCVFLRVSWQKWVIGF
jgi:hypothetical protein